MLVENEKFAFQYNLNTDFIFLSNSNGPERVPAQTPWNRGSKGAKQKPWNNQNKKAEWMPTAWVQAT